MSELVAFAHRVIVVENNESLATTSLNVASEFGKQHKAVLRAIENLSCPEDFRRRNFAPSSYVNEQKKEQPMYLMTREGFMLLVMGFTGSAITALKVRWIEAFKLMEEEIIHLRNQIDDTLRQDVNRILAWISNADRVAKVLPEPLYILPETTRADDIKDAISVYCKMTGAVEGAVFNDIYRDIRKKSPRVDIKARVRNARKKEGYKGSAFQYAVANGYADVIYAVIYEKVKHLMKLTSR